MKNVITLFFLFFSFMSFSQNYIFWGDYMGNEIGRANTDGTNVIQVTPENTTRGLVTDPENKILYYVEGTSKQVKKVSFDGSNPEVISRVSNPAQIELDNQSNHLYISDIGTNNIIRMDLDGSNIVEIISGLESPSSLKLSLDDEKIYYLDRKASGAVFYRSDIDGSISTREIMFSLNTTVQTFDIDFENRKIYWTDRTNGEIRRADLDGSNEESLAPTNDKVASIRVDPINQKLYWTEPGNDRIMTSSLDGSNLQIFKSGITGISNIALNIETRIVEFAPTTDLYWGDYITADLRKLNMNEKDIQVIIPRQNTPRGMAVDLIKNKIFWIEATWGELKTADINGSNEQTLTSFENPSSIALDTENEYIYVIDIDEDKIKRVNYDGSGLTDIISSDNDLSDLFLDFGKEKIYWLHKNSGTSLFSKSNLDGSSEEIIFESSTDIKGFDIDYWNDKIYWTDRTEEAIKRSNLDGTDIETLANSFELVNDIKVDPPNNRIYWTEPTKDRIRTSNLDGSNVETVVNETPGIAGLALGVQNTSTTKNIEIERITIQPNPVSKYLTFTAKTDGNVVISSAAGKVIIRKKISIGLNHINIQNIIPGTYLIILEDGKNIKSGKFIKTE